MVDSPLFSFDRELLRRFSCPICVREKDAGLFLVAAKGDYFLSCRRCNRMYPVVDIKYDKFDIPVKTPFLYPDSGVFAGSCRDVKRVNNFRSAFDICFDSSVPKFCLSADIANRFILQNTDLSGFVVDNGCGHNGVRRLAGGAGIVGFEYEFRKDAYYPIQCLENSEHLSLKSGSVSAFMSDFVLEHVSEQQLYVNEMHRCLKKGGRVVISFPLARWYLAYFISVGSYVGYVKKIFKNPVVFLRNPVRHFLHENCHSSDRNTFVSDIKKWNCEHYERLFLNVGFRILKKQVSGSVFSLYLRYERIARLMNQFPKNGIQVCYVLEK